MLLNDTLGQEDDLGFDTAIILLELYRQTGYRPIDAIRGGVTKDLSRHTISLVVVEEVDIGWDGLITLREES